MQQCLISYLTDDGTRSLVGNALLQAAQVAVAWWHLFNVPDGVLRPIERFSFLPAPMFNVAVGEGKIGAVLMARVREVAPMPDTAGSNQESAACGVLRMIVDENKRPGRTWILKIGLFTDDQRDGDVICGG